MACKTYPVEAASLGAMGNEIQRLREDKAALLAALRGMLERYDDRSAKPAVYCGKLLVGYVAREAAAAARAAIEQAERP